MTDPVAILERWADSGGLWRVLTRRADSVTVGLFRCDGGEQLDEIRSAEPGFLEFLAGRDSSLD
ncbi:MAG: hypothetical protein U0R18_19400 [Mycobacterium sp.]